MRDGLATLLAADATLAALLPGGVHAADEISRELTPTAFEQAGGMPTFLRPCGLVKERAAAADASAIPGATRVSVEVYLYGPRATIEAARRRVRALLDGQAVPLASGVCLEVAWVNDVRGWRDAVLDCPAELSRFRAATMGG